MRKNLKIYRPDLCNISDNSLIGDDCIIHCGVVIYDDVVIGDRCKIQANVFIPNLVTIHDRVFIGPGVIFTNDKKAPSNHEDWSLTIVKNGASIGAGSIILPGVTIGEDAMIGAGSLVTRDVPPGEVWLGSPARFYKLRKDL